MLLRISNECEVGQLTEISREAFHTDYLVGGEADDGPPDYDSTVWNEQMRQEGHLFAYLTDDGMIVGGTVLFEMESQIYVGRIFIHPSFHRMGYELALMKDIEKMNPIIKELELDTPLANIRTNAFYKKLGYVENNRSEDTVFYKKSLR